MVAGFSPSGRNESKIEVKVDGGMGSRPIVVVLVVAMVFGIAVYLRLWAIDFSDTSDDADVLRRQFDLANREAMDESAEWRRMFDGERERASKCEVELREAKESNHQEEGGAAGCFSKLAELRKENSGLLQQIEALKHELQVERLKCNS
ncbi:hypothetical protein MLD38_012280 [Melastoma candidum]|uniref:Uncharacterized protein n=1 Tax=Melastoma candidum TaxID=119954 RepID=A0ACB9RA02_9MYRT|nr:hypothetical protein MLD38_012280 [Melastoma candidum]